MRALRLLCASILFASAAYADTKRIPGQCPGCNIVLISIDTLRADFLPTYGDRETKAPELSAFADSAEVYEEAYSPACTTAEAHMSMMSAQLPSVHQVVNTEGSGFPESPRLPDEIPVLAEILRREGYTTAGFQGNGNVSSELGFGRGFDEYRSRDIAWLGSSKPLVLDWIRSNRDGKFFLFLHTNRVHAPYLPAPQAIADLTRPPLREQLMELRTRSNNGGWAEAHTRFLELFKPVTPSALKILKALYRAEISETSRDIGDVLEAIEPIRDRTIVLVTADHGEEFMEHGRLGHSQHFQEVLRVPLILRVPSRAPVRHSGQVSTMQIAPTLLKLVGIAAPSEFAATALRPYAEPGAEMPMFSVTPSQQKASVLHGPFKLHVTISPYSDNCLQFRRSGFKRVIWNSMLPADISDLRCMTTQLFDLSKDPAEQHPLTNSVESRNLYTVLRQRLQSDRMSAMNFKPTQAAASSTPPEVIKQLKSLGYIQ